jgi:hypothetical protein
MSNDYAFMAWYLVKQKDIFTFIYRRIRDQERE